LPEGVILYSPQYAAEIHRIGDAYSDYPLASNEVLSVGVSEHSPYDIVIASLREPAEWAEIEGSIMMKEGCWTCVWLPPFDVAAEGDAIREGLGVSAVGIVGVSSGLGPKRTIISMHEESYSILGDSPRGIWNVTFLASQKYPARLLAVEVE
jgi:hypothetical protein